MKPAIVGNLVVLTLVVAASANAQDARSLQIMRAENIPLHSGVTCRCTS